ncbi:glutathione S-transferase family protein [Pseudomonas sp. 10B1]|uniref:glutathione S-transferase family protein n=1 Tax=unclassified Pseudomonas TaxID=196821 RepID=UPI002AB4E1F8|nr:MULTISPECIES: glutathione S-transferase family protein [unclassified Pseudomonas]MDY7559121.1 glutathione S-transferase family protein [Pseudomonas sp. AB6]MEA9977687.1 glutathione S-transferase family protein [Pseudomonas sp. RTS4]MEA9996680.1 glutathione S-transferase family protein [Pseudomonas sp. AA4]MEB0087746.1 glutathione S-transferase family protein [Pseudomonas sp. RTI1]MEB0124868.1 glutathione S-transferase family protein [Pseudomonas sp. CCC1.2]
MSELILHHYPTSPFSEKARLMFGFKGLSWRSVMISPVMPKPDLTILTGGYRKTPVLQVGADIYCDTAIIARRLEQEKALPAFFPEGQEFTVASFAAWADSVVFLHAVSLALQPVSAAQRFAKLPPEGVKAFMVDRAGLFSGGNAVRVTLEQAKHQWPTLMARLEMQLERNGDFLFGKPSIADLALAHPLWFVKQGSVTAPLVDDYPAITAWYQRVEALGHGAFNALSASDALEIARCAAPAPLPDEQFSEPNGFTLGQKVIICATDYGVDPVEGELVFSGSEELILRREDERTGAVHVHFPRLGFRIEAR